MICGQSVHTLGGLEKKKDPEKQMALCGAAPNLLLSY